MQPSSALKGLIVKYRIEFRSGSIIINVPMTREPNDLDLQPSNYLNGEIFKT